MLSADDRGNMLGEPVEPKSVFEYMSSKNKERLQTLIHNKSATADRTTDRAMDHMVLVPTTVTPEAQEEQEIQIPSIEPRVAQNALKGFMPYGDDPARQARYKAYLTYFAAPHTPGAAYEPRPTPGKRVPDLNRELSDFANAAAIFKPMTGMMANRFTSGTSAATLLDIKAPEAGLRVPVPSATSQSSGVSEEAKRKKKEEEERAKDDKDPRRLAVKAGQFGPLTRTKEPWYPARLLCKRFNVADPYPEGVSGSADPTSSGTSTGPNTGFVADDKDVLGRETMDELMRGSTATKADYNQSTTFTNGLKQYEEGAKSSSGNPTIPSLADVGLGEDETQGADTLTYKRPPMDIFKAIFADSDDDDEDEDVEVGEATALPVPESINGVEKQTDVPSTAVQKEEAASPVTTDNIAIFKPTFVSKSERSTTNGEKKEKGKKKRSKNSAASLSFDVDDEDGASGDTLGNKDAGKPKKRALGDRDSKQSKKDRKASMATHDEEDEWVEKEQASLPFAPKTLGLIPAIGAESNLRKNVRARASEFF